MIKEATISQLKSHNLFHFSEPPEIGSFSFSKEVMNEGDFAQLSCIVNSGDQPVVLTWSFHGENDNFTSKAQDMGISTTNLGPRMSILVINSVAHHHRGKYSCKARNRAGMQTRTAELKVNG